MTKNPYRGSQFLTSASKNSQFPMDTGREIAFVGRSNVGKSSVINCLTENKNLARTSKTPGRTRLINFFTVNEAARLVDLPGYGFARVDKAMKSQWAQLINDYLANRASLCGIILIIDIRRLLKDDDQELLEWCHMANLPVHLLVNKSDKLPYSKQNLALQAMRNQVSDNNVSKQLFSAVKKIGVEDAISRMNNWLFF
jgi:GTP-binding protein